MPSARKVMTDKSLTVAASFMEGADARRRLLDLPANLIGLIVIVQ